MAELPIAESTPTALTERADAARNRKRILEACAALVAERGIEHVSMHDVAEAAGVGTGTLYRRFGDRAGLALALLDEEDRALQDAMIAGLPPLGPGAPPLERLRAFGPAYLDLLERHADLIAAATPMTGMGGGPFSLYRTHVAFLVRQAAPDADADFVAQLLLGALDARRFLHARRTLGWPVERLESGWIAAVDGLCGSSP